MHTGARSARGFAALPAFKEICDFFAAELTAQLADARSMTTAKLDAPVNKLARMLNSTSIKRVLLERIADRRLRPADRRPRGADRQGRARCDGGRQHLGADAAARRHARRGARPPAGPRGGGRRVSVALKVDEAPLVLNRGFAETMALKRSAGLETVACWQSDAQWIDREVRDQLDALFAHRVYFATASTRDARSAAGLTMAEFSDTVRPRVGHLGALGRPDADCICHAITRSRAGPRRRGVRRRSSARRFRFVSIASGSRSTPLASASVVGIVWPTCDSRTGSETSGRRREGTSTSRAPRSVRGRGVSAAANGRRCPRIARAGQARRRSPRSRRSGFPRLRRRSPRAIASWSSSISRTAYGGPPPRRASADRSRGARPRDARAHLAVSPRAQQSDPPPVQSTASDHDDSAAAEAPFRRRSGGALPVPSTRRWRCADVLRARSSRRRSAAEGRDDRSIHPTATAPASLEPDRVALTSSVACAMRATTCTSAPAPCRWRGRCPTRRPCAAHSRPALTPPTRASAGGRAAIGPAELRLSEGRVPHDFLRATHRVSRARSTASTRCGRLPWPRHQSSARARVHRAICCSSSTTSGTSTTVSQPSSSATTTF